ncbi:HD domain-containing protein, partial [Deinococcus sp. 14RED07]
MPDFPLDATFADALTLAAAWHTGQYRKVPPGQTPSLPYVSHLLGVASIALEYGADQPEAIAALLHDALEDGPA